MSGIRININEPCGERWNDMTPVDEQRAHCKACDRVLVDFTQMDDLELALFLRQGGGNVCGRFREEQLNKRIALPAEKPVKKYWLNAIWLLPLSLFAKPAFSQTTPHVILEKPPRCVPTATDSVAQPIEPTVEIRQETHSQLSSLSGTVTDAKTGKPVEGAEVTLRKKSDLAVGWKAQTNAQGQFTIVNCTIGMTNDQFSEPWQLLVVADHYDFSFTTLQSPEQASHIKLRDEPQRPKMGKPAISRY